MVKHNFLLGHCFFLTTLIAILLSFKAIAAYNDRKVYIVYLGALRKGEISPTSQHLSILQEVLEGGSPLDFLVRSYKRSFNGFAAKLTDKERERLASKENVVSVFPSQLLQLHTTRSWDFLGLIKTVKRKPILESDVIVGLFDTGIWPESKSFSDKDLGPPPKKWKGECLGGIDFSCNKKIIGARYYSSWSARDTMGHGTHTSSIAAGNVVEKVSLYGMAEGIARGGVPSARIAVYKVCNELGCASENVLAAFDDAISDGVDIISISLGYEFAHFLYEDPIAVGSFHAMAAGILTVHSAGNSGPLKSSVASVAPWLFSVGASTTDRLIVDKIVLGNGTTLVGRSLNHFSLNGTMFPIIYGEADLRLADACDESHRRQCIPECLNQTAVKGKIVVCDSTYGDEGGQRAGAIGAIKLVGDYYDVAFLVPFPASALSEGDLNITKAYLNSTKNPTATILISESTKDPSAPKVPSFSSRGPNDIVKDIMKPDITAPGVDILAAYSPAVTIEDGTNVDYNIVTGTSMACPHVAGAAAYIKSFHPSWSHSALRSALMTTARPMNATTNLDGEMAYGSGNLDPIKARNPGLVYEASKDDYLTMLCSMGYKTSFLRRISGDNSSCPEKAQGSPRDLNYPSMTAIVAQVKPFEVNFSRTVTNVGTSNSIYKAVVKGEDARIKVEVKPPTLSFKSKNEKKSFVVTVSGQGLTIAEAMVSASLVWFDGSHTVRSPIVAYTINDAV